jgi:hypothetical protein
MRTFIAALLFCAAPLAYAQSVEFRDGVIAPMTEAGGVSHFSECPSYSDKCTLWVRLPTTLTAAHLEYEGRKGGQLWAPLSVVALSQGQVDALYVPSPVHTFLSGGFWGFRLEISQRFAASASITISSGNGTVYELKPAAQWLQNGR